MRLNKWLALLLAVLLCGALNGALAEADVALDGLAPEAASLEAPLLEDAGIPELEMPDGVELDVDAGPGGTEAPAGETVANWEPYELLHGETRDEHGNVIETYTYFYDEASNCYRILKGNNVRITELGYDVKYNTENITIPGKRRKYRVTEIGDRLLDWGPNTIRSITIPNTVKKIGNSAFRSLRGLKSVTIPKSVTSIGDYAFAECDYLTSVTIPGSVKTLGNGVFSGCKVLAKVKLNKGLKTIGEYAFHGCAFSSIALPDTVTSIRANAFAYSGLKKLTLPDSVTTIGVDAFRNCASLVTVKFSKNLKTIGERAFEESGLKKAILPAKLKNLGNYAFYDCNKLTTASVPLSVTKMGDGVFSSCDKLKKLTIIPKLFKKAGANKDTQVIIPSSVTSIPAEAFSNSSIGQITISSTVKTIGKNAFKESTLKKVTFKQGLKTIGEGAFSETDLTAVTIPSSVTSIGISAFESCHSLKKVTLKEGLKTIGGSAFSETKVTSVSIPASVTAIGSSAFSRCNALATLTLNEGLKTIGASAFSYTSLVTVVIPESVETIGFYAFSGCSSLTSITIPRYTQLGYLALPFSQDITVRTYYNSPAEAYVEEDPWYRLKVYYLDAPTSVTLNYTGTVQLEKYKSLTLEATLAPEGCAPYLTWKSSDTSVAEVSEEGEVSAYRIGKATITVYDANGELAASVDIEVVPPKPTSVSIDCWYDEIGVGGTTTLTAYFDPDDAEATLTWSSSNTGVATVDKNGVVTGVSAGTAVITVTTDNGLSATQEITVVDY